MTSLLSTGPHRPRTLDRRPTLPIRPDILKPVLLRPVSTLCPPAVLQAFDHYIAPSVVSPSLPCRQFASISPSPINYRYGNPRLPATLLYSQNLSLGLPSSWWNPRQLPRPVNRSASTMSPPRSKSYRSQPTNMGASYGYMAEMASASAGTACGNATPGMISGSISRPRPAASWPQMVIPSFQLSST